MIKKLMLLLTCLLVGTNIIIAQTSKVTGVVISEEDNLPVVGASVSIIGTDMGTITDMHIKYEYHSSVWQHTKAKSNPT